MPKVSVIIPAYNQACYLKEALQSVIEQSFEDFEAVVVDDGSTDNTSEIAHSFTDPRVRYIYQENRGLSGARNTGIRASEGVFIAYLDSDDMFLPEKLRLQVAEFEKNPQLGFVAGQAVPIDEEGRRIGQIYKRAIPDEPAELLLGNPLHVGSVMVRRQCQERAGFFDETLRSYEDWDMWLRLVRLDCKAGWIPEPVSLYRFHTSQMTRNSEQMTRATFSVLDKTFAAPGLTEDWFAMEDKAYSRAHLRATASFYHIGDYSNAQAHIQKAVELDSDLLAEGAEPLVRQFRAFADSPKNPDPVAYLERIYHHLPAGFDMLRDRGEEELSRIAIQAAFTAYQNGEYMHTRDSIWYALKKQPSWILNRGVLSIFIRSQLPALLSAEKN
jgi:glycosyltransferase involved in cell wall biosynthesis